MDNKPKKGKKGKKEGKKGQKRSGRQVLDTALEKAEAKERQSELVKAKTEIKERRRPEQQVSMPMIQFQRGGWNRTTFRRKELGEHPILKTSTATSTEDTKSKAVSTEDADEEGTSVIMRPRPKYCEIPLNYNRINQMQLEGYLTRPAVYDMARLYLAYLSKNRDTIYEGQTYLSVGVKLRSMGFPSDIGKTKEVYVTFCKSQGVSEEEVERDLRSFESYIRNRKLSQTHLQEKTRREADRLAFENRPTGCDPECTIQ